MRKQASEIPLESTRTGKKDSKSFREAPVQILIDGYNLLHAIGVRGDLAARGRLEAARVEMLDKLAKYLDPEKRNKTVVIFDQGQRSRNKPKTYHRHGIQVEFAVEFADADSMIEAMIQACSNPQKLLVVSSDHRIQKAAKRRRAQFVDSDQWIDRLEHPQQETKREDRSSSVKPKLQDESSQWLEIFGGDDLGEEATSPSSREKKIADVADDEVDSNESFNPFPEGYGEDLLDSE